MNNIAINVENLSKAYRTHSIGHGTLIRDFESWLAKMRRKPDPYKLTENENGSHSPHLIWALRNISFQVAKGEIILLTGSNGAGKSTLLKILSRITLPTTGKIIGYGRINSLLEIGAGFHPELTGRENIYLNGAMLGMKKYEIHQHLDQIVDFSALLDHIDIPVKRYSSGMYMRLAFSVAAHLQSEILILDEVMAVGDALFQQKCYSKIRHLSRTEGRAILLVSHNTNIPPVFDRELKLSQGRII
jgi:lipopolysaccharide transport system ATP-binding protein